MVLVACLERRNANPGTVVVIVVGGFDVSAHIS